MKKTYNLKSYARYAVQGMSLGVLATVAVFYFTLNPELASFSGMFPWSCLPWLTGLVFCSWALSAARIWLLARSLGYAFSYRQALVVMFCTEFGIAASPAGMGGALAFLTYLRAAGIPLSTAASMLAADVGVDAIFFFALTVTAVPIMAKGPLAGLPVAWSQGFSFGFLLAGLLALALILAALYRGRGLIRRIILNLTGKKFRLEARWRCIRWKIGTGLKRSRAILVFLWRERRLVLVINVILSVFQWLCRYAVLPLIILSFSPSRNPWSLLLIQGMILGVGLMAVLPGGGGGVEILTYFILQYYVPPPVIGLVIVLWRLFTYHIYVLAGGAVFFLTVNHLDRFKTTGRTEAPAPFPFAPVKT